MSKGSRYGAGGGYAIKQRSPKIPEYAMAPWPRERKRNVKNYEALEREIRAAARRSIWNQSTGDGEKITWQGPPRFGQAGIAINDALERAGFAPEILPAHDGAPIVLAAGALAPSIPPTPR